MQIKVASHANHKVLSPHFMPNDVWLSLFIHMCAIILMGCNITQIKVNSHGTGTLLIIVSFRAGSISILFMLEFGNVGF